MRIHAELATGRRGPSFLAPQKWGFGCERRADPHARNAIATFKHKLNEPTIKVRAPLLRPRGQNR